MLILGLMHVLLDFAMTQVDSSGVLVLVPELILSLDNAMAVHRPALDQICLQTLSLAAF